jgi:holliday junction DNA helicase RuvB
MTARELNMSFFDLDESTEHCNRREKSVVSRSGKDYQNFIIPRILWNSARRPINMPQACGMIYDASSMAKDRIIAGGAQRHDDQPAAASLRPRKLNEYIGQRDLVERLSIALQAVKHRKEPMEHVLLHGPPGLGKTTLAHVIAEEMGTRAYVTSGPALTKGADLVGTLTKMQPHDILFIDEIHRLPAAVEEYIYPAMEDFKIDFTLDSGMHAKVITYHLKPFTLIGATTRAGLLTAALRSRFGITHHLQFYGEDDLLRILKRAAQLLSMKSMSADALASIAQRSRGTPRVALRLLRRVRDFAQVRARGSIDETVINDALALEGVDALGLDVLDRKYLNTIAGVYQGGPVGLEAIAATLGEDAGTLEDLVEPYLLQIGFVARTRQGRKLTIKAAEHLNLSVSALDLTLFDGADELEPA